MLSSLGAAGSSSNHAFFWSLSASIENVCHRGPCRYQEPLSRQGPGPDDDSRRPGEPPAVTTASHDTAPVPPPAAPDDDSFPGAHLAVEWTARFFDTVGAVLPYVGESDVLREVDEIDARGQGWLSAARSTQALLSIVFAQALYTMGGERSPEPFYRRALSLLDDKTVYIPTVDARMGRPPFPLLVYQADSGQSKRCFSSPASNRTRSGPWRAGRRTTAPSGCRTSSASTRPRRTTTSPSRKMRFARGCGLPW